MQAALRIACAAMVFCIAEPALGTIAYDWYWDFEEACSGTPSNKYELFSMNTGGRGVLMEEYGEGSIWTLIGCHFDDGDYSDPYAVEYSELGTLEGSVCIDDRPYDGTNVSVAIGDDLKHVVWVYEPDPEQEPQEDAVLYYANRALQTHQADWPNEHPFEQEPTDEADIDVYQDASNNWNRAVIYAYPDGSDDKVLCAEYDGTDWEEHDICTVEEFDSPSISAEGSSNELYATFHHTKGSVDSVVFWRSTNKGVSWSGYKGFTSSGKRSSMRALGDVIFVAWQDGDDIKYDYSTNGGSNWHGTATLWRPAGQTHREPHVNIFYNATESEVQVVLTYEVYGNDNQRPYPYFITAGFQSATLGASGWKWTGRVLLPSVPERASLPDWARYDPRCDGIEPSGDPSAVVTCVWSDERTLPVGYDRMYRRVGRWTPVSVQILPNQHPDSYSGRLRLRSDGYLSHTAQSGINVASGPVTDDGDPLPLLVMSGGDPSLALDGDDMRWVAFVSKDTLWCYMAEDEVVAVFCGSNSHRPGQPSIDVYPDKANGVYVASIVFATYDSTNGTSMIRFAKVDTVGIVLDTIESYATLGDSYPSCRVANSDTIYCVWQHGDSVVASALLDYSSGSTSRPPAWSSLEVLDADGYHPMCEIEGDYLHAVWADTIEGGAEADSWVIRTSTYDITGGGMMGGWQAGSDPSERDAQEKDCPVYCGAGTTVWSEKVSGQWRIVGEVRGDTVTLATADSSLRRPHGQADSSAVSPSINQIRVYVLCDVMTKTDTGEVFFFAESLNVSNAGSDGTESNNGTKLLRKAGSDSLFGCYQDADGAVMYAWSADGSAWQRIQCASHGTYPALASDGTGRRWVVYWDEVAGKVYARFDSSGTFSSARELCDLQADQCGPISAAGSHHPSTSCAYAAFRRIKDGQIDQVILAKFDATNQHATAVLEGNQYVHPCVGTEWVSGDSKDHIHLCWEDTDLNEVMYKMTSSTVGAGEASPTYSWEDDYNLSSSEDDSKDPSMHVSDSRVVVAWSEHSTYDVVAAWRDLGDDYDEFEDTVNLSQSAVNSLYPVVYDADSCIVAWEEHSSEGDIDIYTSVEFETGFCMVDNAGESRYPHCLFQNKASGDTAIPYVHLVFCQEPEENYYEVGYKAWNLKAEGGGGGGQSGGVRELLTPMLSACRPNPFSARTMISYQFPLDGPVNLQVFDASGRSVKTLQNGLQRAGKYTVTWDGRDGSGRNVANGVYFYRFDAPGFRDVKKAVVMK